jgi:3-hydroxyacyl-[acyl-carrier-protein] dehydratase
VRLLLIDRIVSVERGVRATAIKNVTMSEDFLAEHFPLRPIMPGMMIVESMVQLGDWLLRHDSDFASIGLPSQFSGIKFRRVVRPGDQLVLQAEVASREGDAMTVKSRATCDGVLAVTATITLTAAPLDEYLDRTEAERLFALLCSTADGQHDA